MTTGTPWQNRTDCSALLMLFNIFVPCNHRAIYKWQGRNKFKIHLASLMRPRYSTNSHQYDSQPIFCGKIWMVDQFSSSRNLSIIVNWPKLLVMRAKGFCRGTSSVLCCMTPKHHLPYPSSDQFWVLLNFPQFLRRTSILFGRCRIPSLVFQVYNLFCRILLPLNFFDLRKPV